VKFKEAFSLDHDNSTRVMITPGCFTLTYHPTKPQTG